jgi:hypothetical protein
MLTNRLLLLTNRLLLLTNRVLLLQVCYYENNYAYQRRGRKKKCQTLSFVYEFKHDHDTVYFAHCYPYTYTHLNGYLKRLESDPSRAKTFRRRTLCRTLAGNPTELLTITSWTQQREQV